MILLTLAFGLVVLLISAYIMFKAFRAMGKTISYDKSTELLIKQRSIKRSSMAKRAKAVRLNELDLDIDRHLNAIEVDTARQLAKS